MKHLNLLLLLLVLFSFFAQAQKSEKVKKVKLPSGIVMKDNTVTFSDKYTISETDHGAEIKYRQPKDNEPGVIGSFECECKGEPKGGCKLITTESSMTCANSTCNSCKMTAVIQYKKLSRRIQ